MGLLDRFRSLVGGHPLVISETLVTRYITVYESAQGFTIPNPNAPLPLSDLHIEDINAPGLIMNSLPVIFYRTTHTQHPSFSVRLNEISLTSQRLQDNSPHSWHEIVPSRALRPENNLLTLAVSGDGSVTFSDIVIMYQSNELTVEKPLVLDPGVNARA